MPFSLRAELRSEPLHFIQALSSLKKTQDEVARQDLETRGRWLIGLAQAIRTRREAIAEVESIREGLPVDWALRKSVDPAIVRLEAVVAELLAFDPEKALCRPSGLTVIATQGSFSFRNIFDRLAPALAAGNVCLIQLSSLTEASLRVWSEILAEAGIPEDTVSLWGGENPEFLALLASHPSIRAMTFVGFAGTARKVIDSTVHSLKKIQVVGGAKNNLLVLADADDKHWTDVIAGCMPPAARSIYGFHRVFVTESQADALIEKLSSSLRSFHSEHSALARWNDGEVAEFQTLRSQLSEGGTKMHWPIDESHSVILRDLSHCSPSQLEETRLPMLVVNTVKYAHEMAKWCNTGDYGLCSSVWGSDEKAKAMAAKIEVGQCWVNSWLPEAPPVWGWRKSSFGNGDFRWNGSFYSDVRVLTPS